MVVAVYVNQGADTERITFRVPDASYGRKLLDRIANAPNDLLLLDGDTNTPVLLNKRFIVMAVFDNK